MTAIPLEKVCQGLQDIRYLGKDKAYTKCPMKTFLDKAWTLFTCRESRVIAKPEMFSSKVGAGGIKFLCC